MTFVLVNIGYIIQQLHTLDDHMTGIGVAFLDLAVCA